MNDESSEKKDQPSKEASAFLEGLYGDPLRTETMRTGRHLIIASAICAVVVLFNVRLQGTGLVPLDFGNRTDVLPMLLSLAVILLLVSFALRASTDLLREWETARLVIEYIEAERVEAAARSARQTDEQMAEGQREEYEGPYDPDPWWKQYYEVKNAADEAVRKAEERLGIRRLPRHLRRVRTILEAGVPIGFAVIAIILSRTSIFAFFKALALAFLP